MAYQSNFSIVKNELMYGTSKECNGLRNNVCALHLRAASLHTHEKRESCWLVYSSRKNPWYSEDSSYQQLPQVLPGKETIFKNADISGWKQNEVWVTSTCIWFLQQCFTSAVHRQRSCAAETPGVFCLSTHSVWELTNSPTDHPT